MDRSPSPGEHRLGIRENWPQFSLLALINVCVGGMVGLERSDTVIFSFIVAFGLTDGVVARTRWQAGLIFTTLRVFLSLLEFHT